MKAKIIFYQDKEKLPKSIQKRSRYTLGEKFISYSESIDEIYICYSNINQLDWIWLGETTYSFVKEKSISNIEFDETDLREVNLVGFLEGFYKADYRFDRYQSIKQDSIQVNIPNEHIDSSIKAKKIVDAVHIARDICNEPANKLYPLAYAEKLEEIFEGTKVEIRIIKQAELEDEGFHAVNIVGAGSQYEPCVAILTLKTDDVSPVALVGKGVTFDAGGVNVKTASAISEMKMDLGGAAAVTGSMKLLADNEARCNVVAILPLVVNVGSSRAYLPSDVIQYRNGTTVENGNTDAEGRLIIADGILHAQHLGIKRIIDIATLTGNVGQALGLKMAAVFSNRPNVQNKLYDYGQKTGDYVWPMPLEQDYKQYIKSQVADISNMSSTSFAGSITASLFIEHFVNQDSDWIHIDMANTSKTFPNSAKGASGFGTKLLYELVKERVEVWDD